ncbi:MAG: ferrochelatase [Deltaproteobacteria bacterium]
MATSPSTAVFLLNLGGPRDLGEVRPYLYELFADPRILRVPAPWRQLLAFLISTLRAPSSRQKYALIGGGSPLVRGTEAQARALEAALGDGYRCYPAMQCGHPSIAEATAAALAEGATRAVALPLYPQYAGPTTGSALEALGRAWPKALPLATVGSYGTEPAYVEAQAACVREALLTLPVGLERLVVFSAHGLPMRDIRAGDPYEREMKESAEALALAVGLTEREWILTYQSRVRPREWLGPDTVKAVEAQAQGKAVVAVPISFVSEHLETLYDLDILTKDAALRGGAARFVRARAPGDRPELVAALAALALRALAPGNAA